LLALNTAVIDREKVPGPKRFDLDSEYSSGFRVHCNKIDRFRISESHGRLEASFEKFRSDKKLSGQAGLLAIGAGSFGSHDVRLRRTINARSRFVTCRSELLLNFLRQLRLLCLD
jgi:hypothetical protein